MPRSLLLVGLLALAPALGRAQEYSVTVVAILASGAPGESDARLKEIGAEVTKRDKTLTRFKLAQTSAKPVKLGANETFDLVDSAKADVTIQKGASRNDRVRVTVTPPNMNKITYEIVPERYFPLFTNVFSGADKERLLVAVMVKPAK